ncbi:YdcF family protein [Lysinibacillus fusiformis]|uniref:YdcF family protein n=1 Tax=Lysinibacillus fusiformis TaxID=28031 RepID=UPI0018815DB9|nr:YdcF family protein [Lysinibacillus fusiformis]MBD8523192.1 YdcF family protein [Lysinibacillus fusiformis]MCR8853844.1 YdcF family protein [Lysinibacillus fusiformis]WKT76194.1 YdcF family protein [Lysinibacillus fusiformis]WKT79933.1 YdcF family protein [Lysinibacillus fusiformis]
MKKWLIRVGVVLIVIAIVLYIWLGKEIERGVEAKADGSANYMIILGAKVKPGGVPSLSLKSRLEVAVPYLVKYPQVKVIVSGGQGPDEDRTEASVMREYLEQNGIDATRIIEEDQSTSTYENLVFSKELLPKETKKITIVSNDFHLKRAKYLAESLDFEVDVVSAKTPKSVEAKLKIRERAALLKTYIVGY